MTEAEQAALDLIDAQQQTLVALHDANSEKDRTIASLNEQVAVFQQPSDAVAAVAQRKEWFDAFMGRSDTPEYFRSVPRPRLLG